MSTLCVCCAHGQHGSHLIGNKCDCMCHPSNQRKAEPENKPVPVRRVPKFARIGNGLYVKTGSK